MQEQLGEPFHGGESIDSRFAAEQKQVAAGKGIQRLKTAIVLDEQGLKRFRDRLEIALGGGGASEQPDCEREEG